MDLKIQGKTAIMAGGSAGLGRATAERLAEAGVELFITARREERLNRAAQEIADKYGANVTPVVALTTPRPTLEVAQPSERSWVLLRT